MKTTHETIRSMIDELRKLQDKHRLPYANDLWWRLGDAIVDLDRADQATPEGQCDDSDAAQS